MSKAKTITELVTDLQAENESLKRLERLANSYTKQEFGYSIKELHLLLKKLEYYEKKAKERAAAKQGQQPGNERSE